MRLWIVLVSLTGIFVMFQNCGEVHSLKTDPLSQTDESLDSNRDTDFGQTSDTLSVSATLFRAFDQAHDAGFKVIRDQAQNGYDLVLESSNEWLRCGVDFGGGQGQSLGTLVLTYSCSASQGSFSESETPDSLSHRLYFTLLSLYELQKKLSIANNNVIKNGDSFMLTDDFGSLICSTAEEVYLCEYSKN